MRQWNGMGWRTGNPLLCISFLKSVKAVVCLEAGYPPSWGERAWAYESMYNHSILSLTSLWWKTTGRCLELWMPVGFLLQLPPDDGISIGPNSFVILNWLWHSITVWSEIMCHDCTMHKKAMLFCSTTLVSWNHSADLILTTEQAEECKLIIFYQTLQVSFNSVTLIQYSSYKNRF